MWEGREKEMEKKEREQIKKERGEEGRGGGKQYKVMLCVRKLNDLLSVL